MPFRPTRRRPYVAALAALLALAAAVTPSRPATGAKQLPLGEVGSPFAPIGATSPYGAVASDRSEATRAAVEVLEQGGNAIDAAIAGSFALGSAAPGASGLGGNTWILVHTAAGEDVAFLSPLRAPRHVSISRARMAHRRDLMSGPLAITAPGTVATLAKAHARFGTRPWAELLAPAIAIAETGSPVSATDHRFLARYAPRIEGAPILRPLYLTGACDAEANAVTVPVGQRVVYPDLARTLRRLAEAGPDDFYRGRIAAEIVADLKRYDAFLRADDLARVPASIIVTSPLRGRYRDVDVLSLPDPCGGALVLETLHILQTFPSEVLAEQSWARIQLLLDAARIAFADAGPTLAGEEVAEGPWRSPRLTAAFGEKRARLIRLGRLLAQDDLPRSARSVAFSDRDTTHLSVVDREGNAVSLTQSLGHTWGSAHVTPGLGFPYNGFLETYNVEDPSSPAYLAANAASRTAVSPTILVRDGRPVLVLGAAGSNRIPPAIANVTVGYVDGRLGVAEAVAAPRSIWSEGRTPEPPKLELALPYLLEDANLLWAVGYADLERYAPGPDVGDFGALNAVGWNARAGAWEAGGDPRRDGAVAVPAHAPGAPRRESAPR